MDNSQHENAMLDMIKDHCDVMQIQDKIQIIDALRNAMSDVQKTIDSLSQLTREARLEGYRLGRSTAQKDE
jgi:hypothetical protein|tara:strand:+ start:794 stop:1006 length:213 start_codon:yes stop_codon:yes gene_type:complete